MISATELELPWVEKYRPRVLADIVGNEEIVQRLKVIAQTGNMPHMLLTGPPGIGKTTSIACLAYELLGKSWPCEKPPNPKPSSSLSWLGPALIKDAVLELNASDERGIEVVRNQIKQFATKKVVLPLGRQKIVILDEADSMTPGAQQALRRIMEIHSGNTRFALACNNSAKIIEPIQSRCAILRYGRLTEEQMLKRVIEVCQAENVHYTPEGLQAVLFTADGDLRLAINNLQATVSGFSLVTAENVYKVCDAPHPVILEEIITNCLHRQLGKAQESLHRLLSLGYAPVDLITSLFRVVKYMPKEKISDVKQLDFIREIGVTHMRILEGVSSNLQLAGLLARLCF